MMNNLPITDTLSDEADSQQLRLSPVMPSLVHGSLFSGIGGFDLAAEWMGWENAFHCEWNPFGQRILKHYWPGAISYEDITKTDFTLWRGRIDILTGGFPCPPYSSAGKRKGKEDERHLWPEMLRAIREIQPRFVIGENVRGLTNWNGGLVFDEVQADLENEGYEVTPFLLPASSVNAPHQRDRIWFIAYSDRNGHREKNTTGTNRQTPRKMQAEQKERQRIWSESVGNVSPRNATDTERIGQSQPGRTERQCGAKENSEWKASWTDDDGRWPTQSPVSNGNDGISARLDVATISEKDWREESLKSGGNAIVPQVAFQIFKAVGQYVQLTSEA